MIRIRRRPVLVCLGAVVLCTLAGCVWLAFTGLKARTALVGARDALLQARDLATAGDLDRAEAALTRAEADGGRAHDLTDDLVWAAASRVPFAGNTVSLVRESAAAVDVLSGDVLRPVLGVAEAVDPSTLRTGSGTFAVEPLRAAEKPLGAALATATAVQRRLDATSTDHLPGAVADARSQLVTETGRLVRTLSTAHRAAQIVPRALGADGPTRWFLALQTPTEARGTGGLVGGVAIVTADQGNVAAELVNTNGAFAGEPDVSLDLPEEYRKLWFPWRPTELYINSNVSPHFPYAARIWAAKWERQTGQRVDGVATMDPFVLAGLLAALGPMTLTDGTQVDSSNVVDFALRDSYDRYRDNDVREARLRELLGQTVARLLAGETSTREVVEALAQGVGEGRIQVSMPAAEREQHVLESLPVGGALPAAGRRLLGLVVNDAGGSKLGYYATRRIAYEGGTCAAGRRLSTVEVTVGNTAPTSGLPPYVVTRADDPDEPYPAGQRRDYLSLYLTGGTRLVEATLDGKPVELERGAERGHVVLSAYVLVNPGQERTLFVRLDEPHAKEQLQVRTQPLVKAPSVTVHDTACRP
jgi:hypothetical protein